MSTTDMMSTLGTVLTRSRDLIVSLQTPSGAYPASPTFSAYQGFCWFRDGSFIADAASAIGETRSADGFFDWCSMVILKNEDRIADVVRAADLGHPLADSHMLPTRFTFDGEQGSDDWWDFQLDGYGTWLWAVVEHAHRHGLASDQWVHAMDLTVDYLVSSWMRPCFDWWEEHSEAIHISTLGCVQAGLVAASTVVDARRAQSATVAANQIGELIEAQGTGSGHLVKWIGNPAVDGSLSALFAPLGVIDPCSPRGRGTVDEIRTHLVAEGGVYRFRDDTFYGGGRWPLLTCFLGLAECAAGHHEAATDCLRWAVSTATPTGDIPEQVDGGLLLHPQYKQEWIDKWGPVATPLLWSHAMVLRLASQLDLVRFAS